MATPLNGSIVHGFEILQLFSDARREVDTALVCKKLSMNNATAHRLLMTLEHVGALRRIRRGVFVLGSEMERLGGLAERHNPIAKIIEPDLQALGTRLNESVMACRFSHHGPTCIAVATSSRAISVNIEVGTLLPLVRSAQGKLWLAHMTEAERNKCLATMEVSNATPIDRVKLDQELKEILADGYAVNLGDNEPDIAAVSVPVFGHAGRVVLTLSVFGMLSRFDPSFVERARSELGTVAAQVSEHLD
ncbi:MAG: IclR family transcriptional regulator [Rhizobiaceae bacterium]|nr:IclR family transcriptional regulator [Hyphomicrobiales bacterium]NRB29780.1 IclR family transcriptional regulator [Rhizobiaceae bacterium]